jgi:gluconate kinase
MHFDKKMLAAIHQRKFHELDMGPFYDRVIADIFAFQRRSQDFVVSQAIYNEYYRELILNSFSPDIRFVWVKTEDEYLQKARLDARASTGNPINREVYDYMQSFWEAPNIPHDIVINGQKLEEQVSTLLDSLGLCVQWEDGEEN